MRHHHPELSILVLLFSVAAFCGADEGPPRIVPHRGLLRHASENALANFRACLGLRFGFEFDVQRTKDGEAKGAEADGTAAVPLSAVPLSAMFSAAGVKKEEFALGTGETDLILPPRTRNALLLLFDKKLCWLDFGNRAVPPGAGSPAPE